VRRALLALLVVLTNCGFPDYDWCPGNGGMVNVGSFCIDATEVTNAQYKKFLDAKGSDTSGQLAACAWNTTYTPKGFTGRPWPVEAQYVSHPVVGVDWCDAYAYCKWAGKRLCGGMGAGRVPPGGADDWTKSQWMHACTNAGTTKFPYGSPYNDQKCNGLRFDAPPNVKRPDPDHPGTGTVPVKLASGCHGVKAPFDAVFDMTGNVWEWEDDCDGTSGAADKCGRRGGGYIGENNSDACDPWTPPRDPRDSTNPDLGFRCCSP